jgi:UDP-glucose 4-epimerase
MTVLVTGGAGYIGGHMVLALLDAGEDVVVLDNLSTGFRWAVPAGAKLVVGDFGDIETLERIFATHPIDAIAHFAAKIVVPDSVSDPLGYYENNTAKARTLLAAAVRHGVEHFIFSSTAAVYGEPPVSPVVEDTPKEPINPYGRSKLMVEWMLRDVSAAHDLRHVACAISTSPAPIRRAASASRRPTPRISSRSPCRPRSAIATAWTCSARIIRRATAPASATISRSAISSPRICWR